MTTELKEFTSTFSTLLNSINPMEFYIPLKTIPIKEETAQISAPTNVPIKHINKTTMADAFKQIGL